jgi:hypothetical protein
MGLYRISKSEHMCAHTPVVGGGGSSPYVACERWGAALPGGWRLPPMEMCTSDSAGISSDRSTVAAALIGARVRALTSAVPRRACAHSGISGRSDTVARIRQKFNINPTDQGAGIRREKQRRGC